MATKNIPFTSIILPPWSHRTPEMTDDAVIARAKDIMKRGVLNLFTVYEIEGEETFHLGDGHHRYLALELLLEEGKWPEQWETGTIDVSILPPRSAIEILADQLAGNSQKKESSKKEYINSIVRIQKEMGLSLDDLSELIGLSVDYIKSLIKTIRLDDETRDLIGSGEITITNGVALAKVFGKVDEATRADLVLLAKNENVTEFAESVTRAETKLSDDRKALAKANKENGVVAAAPEFVAKKQFIGNNKLEALLVEVSADFEADPSTLNEGRLLVLKQAYQLDDASVDAQRAAWDVKQADKLANAETNRLAAAKKKIAKDQEAVAEMEKALEA